METCVVCFVGLPFINNFEVLDPQFVRDGVRFVICNGNPKATYTADREVIKNFDMLVSPTESVQTEIGEIKADLFLPRFSKAKQSEILQRIYTQQNENNIFKNYRRVACYNRTNIAPVNGRSILPIPHRYVYVKFSDGARGVGNCIFDTKMANIHKFISALRDNDKESLDRMKMAFRMNKGMLRDFSGASFDSELSDRSGQEIIVTEVIPDIDFELRIIVDINSAPFYTEHRKVVSNQPVVGDLDISQEFHDLKQMYDDGTDPNADIFWTLKMPEKYSHLHDEIKEFIKHIPPMNSIDVFITRDGKWGIFEFCNQFSVDDASLDHLMRDYHKSAIYETYLRMKERQKTICP